MERALTSSGKTQQVIAPTKLQRVSENLNSIFVLVKILSHCLLVSSAVKNTLVLMKAHQPLTYSDGLQPSSRGNFKKNGTEDS